MLEVVWGQIKYTLGEFKRLQLMVYLLIISIVLLDLIGLGDVGGWRYRWHKVNLISVGVIIAHFTWSQIFYYWDTSNKIESSNTTAKALVFLGMMVLRGLFYMGIVLAYVGGI